MTKVRLVAFLGLFFLPLAAYGQVTQLSSPSALSSEAVEIDFHEFQDGINAADLLARWGVRFEASANSTPRVRLVPPVIGGGQPDIFLENQPNSGTSADEPLIINFKYPVSKVGMVLSNGGALRLTAYNSLGVSLGAIVETFTGNSMFIGVATTTDQGIAKLKIDYTDSDNPEQVDDLVFEFLSRPLFTTFLSQIGDAADLLQTIVVVSNLSNSTAQGELRLFESDGDPLTMPLSGTTNSVFPFEIPPLSSKTLTSPGTSAPLKVGYAKITSNVPVDGTAIFRVIPGGSLLAEVGVGAAPGRYVVVGVAHKVAAQGFDTGVAVVNAADQPANISALLVAENGNIVGTNFSALDLAAHGHTAKFIGELFPSFADDDFQGTLVVTSDQPMGIVVVRTLGGTPRSALPVSSMQQ